MARVMLTGRVTDTQAAALTEYAKEVGLPLYQATVRALEIGIAALIGGRGAEAENRAKEGTAAEEAAALREVIDRLTIRAGLTDRLVQRTLYASCAAYAAALGKPDEGRLAEIARDADLIFERQLTRAQTAEGEAGGNPS